MRMPVHTLAFLFAFGFSIASVSAQEKRLRDLVDAEIEAGWKRDKLTPAPAADDATYLRRVYLDLTGSIPTYAETKAFLADTDSAKRTKLVERLLKDPQFAVHQADVWEMALFGRNPPNPEATRVRTGIKKWLNDKFAKDVPYNQWVKDILLAEGNSFEDGPAMFYMQFRAQPEETAVGVTRIFMGIQLACAQCHDHPSDTWSQRDFYGMAAFFARLVVVDGGGVQDKRKYMIGEKRTGEVLFTGEAKQAKPGQKGTPVGARFLKGEALKEPALPADFKEVVVKSPKEMKKPDFSRKEKLAEWLSAPENPYLARAVVNRVWGQVFRRGIIHPVDNISETNKASHEGLIEKIAAELVKKNFDLKWLLGELVQTKAYQIASVGPTGDPLMFEQFQLRPLSAEEMVVAMKTATGIDKMPAGFSETMVRHFGTPTDGRGDFQASLTERLFVNNSLTFRGIISRNKGSLWDEISNAKTPVDERVDRLFLTVLNRPARAAEKERFGAYINSPGTAKDSPVEEAIWALLASAEFRFNH